MLKSQIKNKMNTRTFKSCDKDFETIQKKAKKFAAGNTSEWIRHAALNHVPKKSALVATKATKKK